MINRTTRKLTLEERISRLEKVLNANRKFESFESKLDEAGARAKANQIASEFGALVGADVELDDLGRDVIDSPLFGWLTVDDTDEIAEDRDAKFAFQYSLNNGDYTIIVYPSKKAVWLLPDSGYAVDPKTGAVFEPESHVDGAFAFPKWKRFDLSMIHDEDDEDY